jgi:hypothetical protein
MRVFRLLLDPAPEAGGGNVNPPAPDPAAAFSAALAKFNGDNAALARDSWQTAERLRAELAEVRPKLPPKDARVLSKDEDAAYTAFMALGKPDEVAKAIEDGKSALDWRSARERKDLIVDAAKAHDFDPDVLEHLAGPGLVLAVADVTRNGKPAKIAQVVTKDESGKEARTDLDKHAAKAWPKFLESLKSKATAAVPGNTARRTTLAPPAPDSNAARRPRLTL